MEAARTLATKALPFMTTENVANPHENSQKIAILEARIAELEAQNERIKADRDVALERVSKLKDDVQKEQKRWRELAQQAQYIAGVDEDIASVPFLFQMYDVVQDDLEVLEAAARAGDGIDLVPALYRLSVRMADARKAAPVIEMARAMLRADLDAKMAEEFRKGREQVNVRGSVAEPESEDA